MLNDQAEPESIMNLKEHLLVCLAEEGSEVAQSADKALRFGIDDVNVLNPEGPDNQQRLIDEINDLIAVVRLCAIHRLLPIHWEDESKQAAKMGKVEKFMAYARSKGTLVD